MAGLPAIATSSAEAGLSLSADSKLDVKASRSYCAVATTRPRATGFAAYAMRVSVETIRNSLTRTAEQGSVASLSMSFGAVSPSSSIGSSTPQLSGVG